MIERPTIVPMIERYGGTARPSAAGGCRPFTDPVYGIEASVPNDWLVKTARRYGDFETSICFRLRGAPSSFLFLYYKRHKENPTGETLEAVANGFYQRRLRERRVRDGYSDYRLRQDSYFIGRIANLPSVRWIADYSCQATGWSESVIRCWSGDVSVCLALRAHSPNLDRLMPGYWMLINSLKFREFATARYSVE